MAQKAKSLQSKSGNYWLVKTEPGCFGIDDLIAAPKQTTYWDGVRNYQARNTLRDEMQLGDHVLFYHSNANPPSVVGVARIVKAGYPDFTAFDPKDQHYDPKSKPAEPTWYMVDIEFVEKFNNALSLESLKKIKGLENMVLLQRGSRLSVQPVRPAEFEIVVRMGRA